MFLLALLFICLFSVCVCEHMCIFPEDYSATQHIYICHYFPPLVHFSFPRKILSRRAWQTTPVFLPGESPCTEKPGGLQSMVLQRVRHDWATFHFTSLPILVTGLQVNICNIFGCYLINEKIPPHHVTLQDTQRYRKVKSDCFVFVFWQKIMSRNLLDLGRRYSTFKTKLQ